MNDNRLDPVITPMLNRFWAEALRRRQQEEMNILLRQQQTTFNTAHIVFYDEAWNKPKTMRDAFR